MPILSLSLGAKTFRYHVDQVFKDVDPVIDPMEVPKTRGDGEPPRYDFQGCSVDISALSAEQVQAMYQNSDAKRMAHFKVRLVGSPSSIFLYRGVTVLMGGSGSGKTALSTFITRELNKTRSNIACALTYCEPELFSATGEPVIVSEQELMDKMAAFLCSEQEVIVIDSIRDIMYQSHGGATGKGGVNMAIFSVLTRWDVLAQRLGKCIIFNVNPLNVTEDVLAQFKEAAAGSVTSVINMPAPNRIEFTSRDSAWRSRSWKDLRQVDIVKIATANGDGPTPEERNLEVDEIPALGRNSELP